MMYIVRYSLSLWQSYTLQNFWIASAMVPWSLPWHTEYEFIYTVFLLYGNVVYKFLKFKSHMLLLVYIRSWLTFSLWIKNYLLWYLSNYYFIGFSGCWPGLSGWWKQTRKTSYKTYAYSSSVDQCFQSCIFILCLLLLC